MGAILPQSEMYSPARGDMSVGGYLKKWNMSPK